jgi:hypothetical protein
MATYHLNPDVPYLRRRRAIAGLRSVAYAAATAVLWRFGHADWLFDFGSVSLLLAGATAFGVWSTQRQMRRSGAVEIVVSPEGVRRTSHAGRETVLPRADIVSLQEYRSGAGLIVRSKNPRTSVLVPADLDFYEACRAELVALGIPEVPFDARTAWRLRTVGAMFYALLMMPLATSQLIRIASVATLALAGAAVLVFFRKPRGAKATCEVTPQSPDAKKRIERRVRWLAVGLLLAGEAIMAGQAWWAKNDDHIGLGFGVLMLGILCSSIFFGEAFGVSLLRLGAILAGAAGVGALLTWAMPGSDVGWLAGVTVGMFSALLFAGIQVARRGWLKWLESVPPSRLAICWVLFSVVHVLRFLGCACTSRPWHAADIGLSGLGVVVVLWPRGRAKEDFRPGATSDLSNR